MNLRIRFALLFSLLVFIILMVSVVSIYFLYEKFRKEEFYERVRQKALLYNAYRFGPPLKKTVTIDSGFVFPPLSLTSENIIIFDASRRLIQSNPQTPTVNIPPSLAFYLAKKKSIYQFRNDYQESILQHVKNSSGEGYVLASAYDKFGRSKIDNLKIILLSTLGGGLVLSGLFAFFYVKQIIKPLADLTNDMHRITESNMESRLKVSGDENELNLIALNFNDMLDKLENAFEMRKRFVQHASHELRTPLTNMLAQTEAALTKQLSHAESHAIFRSLREDQQHLIDLTNSLLLLSKYEKMPVLTDLTVIRVDETLYEAIDSISLIYTDCNVLVNFTTLPENDALLTVLGNEVLLRSALQNLVDNACRYSEDKQVNINIDASASGIIITFENMGKQLTYDEMQRLFIPFFRGENSAHKKGFGLGLSIVQRIIDLHKGTINYMPVNDSLNRFSVFFPRLNT